MRSIRYTATARAVIDSLPDALSADYFAIEEFLREFPYAIRGSLLVEARTLLGQPGFVYFEERFPYLIFYQATDTELRIVLVA